ncbi:UDP-N-acetylmuramate--L-alanine ligase [Boudabousia tangfeifanii]|uniref:UDP-N-acetylmuramate--L-alanine ligase n=1 Tax=Boudabousia tangfeifanii TaxID=1912795 RepID=A0A1D9MKL0_9ACTO|nr:UDP-N-acetylmuramate--L-alanine ligase [Boudabousia tangfeifanii]AOZ72844.1 UDP-N-acetylmuramate--L-alanine ligase [Boudabousia tangfeifanii]
MTKFHFIGIGGVGMNPVARLLAARGMEVTGSDGADSPVLSQLAEVGIKTYVGHRANQVPEDAIVVVSSAIRENNPELAQTRKNGQKVIHRSQALALAASGMRFVAVAGAHGKTTTSGMISVALSAAGLDPSFAVGSVVKGFDSGAHLGQSDIFVAEADESDGSFLNYQPTIEVITGIEPDHLDFYGDFKSVKTAFSDFAQLLPADGTAVIYQGNEASSALAKQLHDHCQVITYGSDEADVNFTNRVVEGNHQEFEITGSLGQAKVVLEVGGVHNALNALAAWIVARQLGVEAQEAADALGKFSGTARRFDFKGEVNEIRVFDDYAHHPSEVKMAVAQAQSVVKENGRTVIAFQPHLYSRTDNFAKEFAQELAKADLAFVLDVYRAREAYREDINARTITDLDPRLQPSGDLEATTELLAEVCQPGDVVVTMGAGSVTQIGPMLLERLAQRG